MDLVRHQHFKNIINIVVAFWSNFLTDFVFISIFNFFVQITEQLNKRTAGNYCKDQVTAKLQNLKAQFRQRRAAVEAGHGEMRDWKWYDRMQEIMSDGTTETYTDFDGKSRGSNSRSPTPASAQAQALNGKILLYLTDLDLRF